MTQSPNPDDVNAFVTRIRAQADAGEVRVTQHAHQEMVEESLALDEVLQVLGAGEIIETYPVHRRGPCCLLHGVTVAGRHLHVVCTTAHAVLIIITVYEPRPPKWLNPTQRRRWT